MPWRERRPFNVGGRVVRDTDSVSATKIVHTLSPSKVYEELQSKQMADSGLFSIAGIGFAVFHAEDAVDFTSELLFPAPSTSLPVHISIATKALDLGPKPTMVKLLGSGAEADVYLVVDRFNREVAAKVFYESKSVPEHIYGHAVGLARVPHAAVAELYTIDEVLVGDRVVPAILMELLIGQELEVRLQQVISVDELVAWSRTLLEVFEAMHSVEHFHPDPHPGNFFVTDQGLRLYDVLHTQADENRSTNSKELMRAQNARRVREIIEAMFDRVKPTDPVRSASRLFTTNMRNTNITLGEIRRAFGDAIEQLKANERAARGLREPEQVALSPSSPHVSRETAPIGNSEPRAVSNEPNNIVVDTSSPPSADPRNANAMVEDRWREVLRTLRTSSYPVQRNRARTEWNSLVALGHRPTADVEEAACQLVNSASVGDEESKSLADLLLTGSTDTTSHDTLIRLTLGLTTGKLDTKKHTVHRVVAGVSQDWPCFDTMIDWLERPESVGHMLSDDLLSGVFGVVARNEGKLDPFLPRIKAVCLQHREMPFAKKIYFQITHKPLESVESHIAD